jgi:hypothetical protein
MFANRKFRRSMPFGLPGPSYTPYHMMAESRPHNLLLRLVKRTSSTTATVPCLSIAKLRIIRRLYVCQWVMSNEFGRWGLSKLSDLAQLPKRPPPTNWSPPFCHLTLTIVTTTPTTRIIAIVANFIGVIQASTTLPNWILWLNNCVSSAMMWFCRFFPFCNCYISLTHHHAMMWLHK